MFYIREICYSRELLRAINLHQVGYQTKKVKEIFRRCHNILKFYYSKW